MEILTGNELFSGATVYLDAEGHWGDQLQLARVFGPEDLAARDAAIAASKATERIVSIEVEKVSIGDAIIVPNRLRERIRATGSTAPVFSRQTLGDGDHVSI